MSIYVFDIDGTISKGGLKVHPAICHRLASLAKNNQLFFASARPVRDMLPMLSEDLHSATFIGCNGGMTWRDGEIIHSHTLAPAFVARVLQHLKELKIPYVLDGEWNYSVSEEAHPFHDYIHSLSNHEAAEESIIAEGVTKILVLSGEHKERILTHLKVDDISLHAHRSDGFYDFTPQGNNKYRTLTELIGGEEYVAFGNDQNDFIMLSNAKISVFVGEREIFGGANYYVSMDYIPGLLNHLESKANLKEELVYDAG
ncbi:HAD hydrolase family protein [Kalamiella sp. sgz302252]|uniref:HAD hydrolase family protein n=1 Tax=Pantoea sp. sgz302252 TaxID=3341827 RepID=UPI0036D3FA13